MSLSDKFYEGLSAPLPVAGAQMPVDLVPYAGKPLDPLRAHEAKYKQLEYLQRLSDQASKAALKERLEADMDKVGFVGSNALSRRQYYMDKLAREGEGKGPSEESFTPNKDMPPEQSAISLPPREPLPSRRVRSLLPSRRVKELRPSRPNLPEIAPLGPQMSLPRESLPPRQPPRPAPNPDLVMSPQSLHKTWEDGGMSLTDPAAEEARDERFFREIQAENQEAERLLREEEAARANQQRLRDAQTLREGRLDYARDMARENTRDSGAFMGGIRDFRNRYRGYGVPEDGQPQKPSAQKPRPKAPEEPELGFYDSVRRTLDHYGTRAARGLSTGAQMAASRVYDSNLLGLKDYMDKDQMARINASLYHAYGGNPEDEYAKAYADRYRALRKDQGIVEEGAAPRPDLLNRDQFRNTILEDQMAAYRSRGFNPAMRRDLRNSARQTIDNMYGFEGNRLGTGTIGEDLSLSPFRRALAASGQEAATQPGKSVAKQDAAAAEEAAAAQAAQAAEAEQRRLEGSILNTLNERDPEIINDLKLRTGYDEEEDGPFIPFLAELIRREGSREFQADELKAQDDPNLDAGELRNIRNQEANSLLDMTLSNLNNNPEMARAFLSQVNPRAIQVANDLATLFDTDPQAALRQVNNMDPAEARYHMEQLEIITQAMGLYPDSTSGPRLQPLEDYSKYQVAEDSESPLSFLPSFGGTDTVNRARQQIGAGGDLDQMEGDARQRAFLYNSMRDVPQGRYYKVEDDVLGNTYFNPVTGDINYEYGTDFGNLNPFRAYNTAEPLPERYHEQYRRLQKRYPGFRG